MKIEQKKYSKSQGWQLIRNTGVTGDNCRLVLAFGSVAILTEGSLYHNIREFYPHAEILINSTAGEILDTEVNDDTISLTAIYFEKTEVASAVTDIKDVNNSYDAGSTLAKALKHEGLKYVFVISDGHMINGSALVAGLQDFLPKDTVLTGGLAGDGARFKTTLVGLNDQPAEGKIAAVGFYGDNLMVNYGSAGGWDAFGPQRLITRATDSILYEMDGQPALAVYKKYLGTYAKELPGSALLFPLSVCVNRDEHSVVRTILGVNEEDQSLTFAGNMPQGAYAQLMMANMDRLVEGASAAALQSINKDAASPDLAILISCVGRKLVLDQRIEEEVEIVRAVYGSDTAIAGFYSYGEISPSGQFMNCDLHNQTMTITTLTER
jgi:hypothetical protein